jgi:hypothetical protein
MGIDKEYTSVQLNDLFTNTLSKEIVKTGKVIEGTEIAETEYVSITKPSAKEDKRKINTFNE